MTQGTSPHCTLITCARADLSSRSWGGRQIESGLVGSVFIRFLPFVKKVRTLTIVRFSLVWNSLCLLSSYLYDCVLPLFLPASFLRFSSPAIFFFQASAFPLFFFSWGEGSLFCVPRRLVSLSLPHWFFFCSLSSAIPLRCNIRTCQESSARIGTLVISQFSVLVVTFSFRLPRSWDWWALATFLDFASPPCSCLLRTDPFQVDSCC